MESTLPYHCPAVNVDVWTIGVLVFYILPYGQHMPKRERYIVEVLLVPLPANEMEERRRRLRALLLTGAVRLVQQQRNSNQMPLESETPEMVNAQVLPK
jgi:hypothetical protein